MVSRLATREIGRGGIPDRGFVQELFGGLAPRYDRVLLLYSFAQDLRWKQVLIRRLHPKAGERALDLACGTGLLLDRLSKVLGASHTVGVDINRPMLLQRLHAGHGPPLLQADAERLPLDSNAFDIVSAGYLLKYVELDRFFLEVARVLRPGGRFAGYDFSRPVRSGPVGTVYAAYLHRLVPLFGRRGGQARGGWRSVFEFLPRVAELSGWETRVHDALERSGFEEMEVVPSLGGAITWVWARKRLIDQN